MRQPTDLQPQQQAAYSAVVGKGAGLPSGSSWDTGVGTVRPGVGRALGIWACLRYRGFQQRVRFQLELRGGGGGCSAADGSR
jgi:hypothetical protein